MVFLSIKFCNLKYFLLILLEILFLLNQDNLIYRQIILSPKKSDHCQADLSWFVGSNLNKSWFLMVYSLMTSSIVSFDKISDAFVEFPARSPGFR